MSIIKDTFFGGAEKKAAKAQQKALEQSQAFTREGVEQARSDIMDLFPKAQRTAQQGFQGALDVFAETLPQQAQAFTGGNVAAQQALLAGLPHQQAAILGGQAALQPLNIQPFQLQPDFSFAQQQIPGLSEPVVQAEQQVAEQPPFNPLSGSFGLDDIRGRFGGNNVGNNSFMKDIMRFGGRF